MNYAGSVRLVKDESHINPKPKVMKTKQLFKVVLFSIGMILSFLMLAQTIEFGFIDSRETVHVDEIVPSSHPLLEQSKISSTVDTYYFCGTYDTILFHAQSHSPDSTYMDIWGNTYDMFPESGRNNSISRQTCYFNLIFDDSKGVGQGTGGSDLTFDTDFQNTTLAVFDYLCSIINQRSLSDPCNNSISNSNVNILIEFADPSFPAKAIAAGSPHFPPETSCTGIIKQGRPYIKINGGYLNFSGANDGTIIISLDAMDDDLFFTDYPSSPSGSQQYDLYSVMMHEALHVLGFTSNLPKQGSYSSIWFTQFDRLLNSKDGSNYNFLMENDCNSECYELQFDGSELGDFANTPCTVQVGADGPFVDGNFSSVQYNGRFSHLINDATCGNDNYLMKPIPNLEDRIGPSSDELDILCALGYSLNIDESGDPNDEYNCDGCYLLPVSDLRIQIDNSCVLGECCMKEYHTCEESILIPFEEILCMVLSSDEAEVTHASIYNGGATSSLEQDGVLITYNGTGSRLIYLDYGVTGCSECRTLSYGRLTISFDNCLEDCLDIDMCENDFCLSDFDGINEGHGYNFGYHYIFAGLCNNSPELKDDGSDKFLLIGDGESSTFKLNEGPYLDCNLDLDITFRLSSTATNLRIWGSEYPPCQNEFVPFGCDNVSKVCDNGTTYEPTCLLTIDGSTLTPNSWYSNSYTFLASNLPNNVNYLIFTVLDGLSYARADISELNIVPDCIPSPIIVSEVNCLEVCFDVDNPGGAYLWNFDDGNTSTEISPCHIFEEAGTYDVTVSVTGPCGEEFSDVITINVLDCQPMDLCEEFGSDTPDVTIGEYECDVTSANGEGLLTSYDDMKFKI